MEPHPLFKAFTGKTFEQARRKNPESLLNPAGGAVDFEVFGQKIGRDRLFPDRGPCVIESGRSLSRWLLLKAACVRLKIPFVFKSSYDKANRTSSRSYRGPGLEKGLSVLARVRDRSGSR